MPHFLGEIHIIQRASDNWKHEPVDSDGNRVLRIRPPKRKEKQFGYLSQEVPEPSESDGAGFADDGDEGDGD